MTKNIIPLAEAVQLTTTFRAQRPNVIAPPHVPEHILPTCETFDRAAFDVILSKPDCVGVRIYNGMKADLTVVSVIVGVDSQGRDIITQSNSLTENEEEEEIIEDGTVCPPICPPTSPLNP